MGAREPLPGEGERRALTGAAPGLTVREALGTGRFWLLGGTFFLVALGIVGMQGQYRAVIDRLHGLSPALAAATLGMFGLATLTGRLVVGFLVDRIYAPCMSRLQCFSLRRCWGLRCSPPLPVHCRQWASPFRWELGLGSEIDMIAFLTSRYFGQRMFGEIYG